MRPTLRSYVYFERHERGVFFRKGSDSFILQGRGLYAPVARLLDHLDGRQDLAAIERQLAPKLVSLLHLLIGELSSRGYLVDRGDADVSELPLLDTYATVVAYLADHVPNAGRKFLEWRDSEITIAGAGYLPMATVAALSSLGASAITVHIDPKSRDDQTIALLQQAGARLADLPTALADAIFVADSLETPYAERAFATSSFRMIAGGLRGRLVMAAGSHIAPTQLAALIEPPEAVARPTESQLVLLGNLLAYDLFRRMTGVVSPDDGLTGKIVEADLSVRSLFPLPPPLAEGANETDRQLSEFERRWEQLKALFDPVTGLFFLRKHSELLQVPLMHQEIELRSQREADRLVVHGWGLGFDDAALRTLRLAAEIQIVSSQHRQHGIVMARTGAAGGEARARMLALIGLLDPVVRAKAATGEIDPATLSGDTLILWRLAKSASQTTVRLEGYAWDGGFAATVVEAMSGNVLAWGAEPDRREALKEAIGSYCSHLQLGTPPVVLPDHHLTLADIDVDPRLQTHGFFAAGARGAKG